MQAGEARGEKRPFKMAVPRVARAAAPAAVTRAAPEVAFNDPRGRPAAFLVRQCWARAGKVASGPTPPSTPTPRQATRTQPEPRREPLRSTVGTQTDDFVDITKNKDFMAQVQRAVVEHLDVKIKDALTTHMQAVAKKFLEDQGVSVAAVSSPMAGRPAGVSTEQAENKSSAHRAGILGMQKLQNLRRLSKGVHTVSTAQSPHSVPLVHEGVSPCVTKKARTLQVVPTEASLPE